MKKYYILSFTLLVLFNTVRSQVIINPQLPQQGVVMKNQLWNLSIIKTTTANISIIIEMTFTDASNGQRVFIGTSKTIQLNQQITQMQQPDVTPVVYNVLNSSYNINNSQDGFLPVGQFEVCYAVMEIVTEGTEKVAEACEGIEIEPLSPPLLVFPEDQSVTDLTRPLFTWLPPSPLNAFSSLSYDMALVELTGLQTPSDAINQNLAIYSATNLVNNFCAYPASLPELDTSKIYAWQISAHSSNNAISKSDVWVFRTRLYGIDTLNVETRGYFSPVRRMDDASYITTTGILRVEYLHELSDSIVNINYFDLSINSRDAISANSIPIVVNTGKNYLSLPFKDLNGVIDHHFYLLEIENSKGEKSYLKFQYRNEDSN